MGLFRGNVCIVSNGLLNIFRKNSEAKLVFIKRLIKKGKAIMIEIKDYISMG